MPESCRAKQYWSNIGEIAGGMLVVQQTAYISFFKIFRSGKPIAPSYMCPYSSPCDIGWFYRQYWSNIVKIAPAWLSSRPHIFHIRLDLCTSLLLLLYYIPRCRCSNQEIPPYVPLQSFHLLQSPYFYFLQLSPQFDSFSLKAFFLWPAEPFPLALQVAI